MAVSKQHLPKEHPINGETSGKPAISSKRRAPTMADELNVPSKRQRRPSVRLVEIGDQSAAALYKQCKPINRVSRTHPLTNIADFDEGKEEKVERVNLNSENLEIGSLKIKDGKPKKDLKRPRKNWVSNKIDINDEDEDEDEGLGLGEGGSGNANSNANDNVDKDGNDFSRDFLMEVSGSSLKEQNTEQDSLDNEKDVQFRDPHRIRERIVDDGVDFDDGGQNSSRKLGGKLDGVRVWLDELGLSRYWPAFKFHEVDELVLPLLTLDDLKDMGINAVGSRRKMYCAIQKLHRRLS